VGSGRAPGKKLLVVRGSRLAADIARLLKHHGFNADQIERATLLEHAPRLEPVLILSDVSVGGMREVEDAICLRQMLPACKVLLFSGQGLRRPALPRESELELVRTIEHLCDHAAPGQILWLDLGRFLQFTPRQKSVAA
jgi:hypothetical protein